VNACLHDDYKKKCMLVSQGVLIHNMWYLHGIHLLVCTRKMILYFSKLFYKM